MRKYKIIIEGEGPHHSDSHDDADSGAKHLVEALKRRGHTVSDARFVANGTQEDINVEVQEIVFEDAPPNYRPPVEHGSMTASGPPPAEPADQKSDNSTTDDAKTDQV